MRFSRRVSIVVLALVSFAVFAGLVAIERIRSPQSGVDGGIGPRAVVDATPWEAGIIERLEQSDHTFVVRNDGDAPLVLSPGVTSCSCTLAESPDAPIPPGGEANVRVATKVTYEQSHDKLKSGPLVRVVRLATNEPGQNPLSLTIHCTVVRPLDAEPSSIALLLNPSAARSQEKRTAKTVVYSETWEKFSLEAVKCSPEGIQWRIEPAEPAELAALGALSGYRVELSIAPDMPEGYFKGSLDLSAKPVETGTGSATIPRMVPARCLSRFSAGAPRTLSLPIHGSVAGRISITGRNVRGERTLDLGTLKEGQTVRTFFLLKINDERKTLCVKEIQTNPQFLRVRLAPSGGAPQFGLYRFEVELPNAPRCNFLETAGFIRLKTDHPRLPVVDVRVEMAVLSAT